MPYKDKVKQAEFHKNWQAEHYADPVWKQEQIKTTSRNAMDRQRANLEWLRTYKLAKGCIICGYKKHPAALEFHHRNPKEKRFTISRHPKMSIAALKREIEKCDVICRNCHAVHHDNERNGPGVESRTQSMP